MGSVKCIFYIFIFCYPQSVDMFWQVEELEVKLLDRTREVERLRSELVSHEQDGLYFSHTQSHLHQKMSLQRTKNTMPQCFLCNWIG